MSVRMDEVPQRYGRTEPQARWTT